MYHYKARNNKSILFLWNYSKMTLPFTLSLLHVGNKQCFEMLQIRQFEFTTKNRAQNDAHSISLCSLWTTCHNFISDILWQICREQNICNSAINSASLIWWQENNVSRARACKWVTKYRFIRRKKNEKEKSALKDNSIKVKVLSKWIVTRIEEIDENRVRVWSLKCRQDFFW